MRAKIETGLCGGGDLDLINNEIWPSVRKLLSLEEERDNTGTLEGRKKLREQAESKCASITDEQLLILQGLLAQERQQAEEGYHSAERDFCERGASDWQMGDFYNNEVAAASIGLGRRLRAIDTVSNFLKGIERTRFPQGVPFEVVASGVRDNFVLQLLMTEPFVGHLGRYVGKEVEILHEEESSESDGPSEDIQCRLKRIIRGTLNKVDRNGVEIRVKEEEIKGDFPSKNIIYSREVVRKFPFFERYYRETHYARADKLASLTVEGQDILAGLWKTVSPGMTEYSEEKMDPLFKPPLTEREKEEVRRLISRNTAGDDTEPWRVIEERFGGDAEAYLVAMAGYYGVR